MKVLPLHPLLRGNLNPASLGNHSVVLIVVLEKIKEKLVVAHYRVLPLSRSPCGHQKLPLFLLRRGNLNPASLGNHSVVLIVVLEKIKEKLVVAHYRVLPLSRSPCGHQKLPLFLLQRGKFNPSLCF